MSGPFLVPSAIIAALLSDSWARPVFWACAFLAALFTVYKIWAVERNRMIEIESRMRDEIEELKERLKPKLGFLFKNGIHECYSDDDEHQGCYLRLMVKSVCDVDVVGVQGVLVAIEKGGVFDPQDRRPLPFAPCRPADPPDKTFKPGAEWPLDIFRIDTTNNSILIATKGNFSPVRDAQGQYLYETSGPSVLVIEIQANGMKMVTKKLNFFWKGKCRNPEPEFSIKE